MKKYITLILILLSGYVQSQGVSVYTSSVPTQAVTSLRIGVSQKDGNVITQRSLRADSLPISVATLAALSLKQDISTAFTQSLADARYSLLSHTHPFTAITLKPTTVAGYGITDALTPSSIIAENQLQTTGKVFLSSDANLEAYGTSYSAGYVASSYGNNGFPALIAQKFGKTLSNRGAAGAADHWINMILNNNLGVSTTRSLLLEMGINTLRLGQLNLKSLEKFKASVTQSIAAWWTATGYPASSASITRTGTWATDVTGSPFPRAPKYSGTGMYTSQSGATAALTFTGSTVAIGFAVTDGTIKHSGSFDYYLDGVKFGTYNTQGKTDGVTDNNNDATIVNSAIIINNLGNAPHTISITTLTADTVHLDFISVLKTPSTAPAIVAFNLPKLPPVSSGVDNSNYLSLVGRYNDTLTAIVRNLSGFPITIADIYNSLTSFYIDNLHPDDQGHRQVAEAASRKIYGLDVFQVGGSLNVTANNTKYIDLAFGGTSVGAIDYSNGPRLIGMNNMAIYIGGSGNLFVGGGGTNSSTINQMTSQMSNKTTATSTATQSGSHAMTFATSVWNGSAAVIPFAGYRTVPSTTVNGDYRLATFVNGSTNLTAATEAMAVYYQGGLPVVGIGTAATTPAASAIFDVTSTTKGVVLPRMTKAQRDAIVSPVAGLEIFQTDNTPGKRVYNGANWMRFTETVD